MGLLVCTLSKEGVFKGVIFKHDKLFFD